MITVVEKTNNSSAAIFRGHLRAAAVTTLTATTLFLGGCTKGHDPKGFKIDYDVQAYGQMLRKLKGGTTVGPLRFCGYKIIYPDMTEATAEFDKYGQTSEVTVEKWIMGKKTGKHIYPKGTKEFDRFTRDIFGDAQAKID